MRMTAGTDRPDAAFHSRHRVARRYGGAAAGAGGVAVSRFRNGAGRTARRGFRAGVGGACRELFDRCDVAGVDRSRAADRAVDRQCRGVLAVHARALFDEAFTLRWWHALVWVAVATFSFVNCMWIAPASGARLSVIAINLIALGFIALAVAQTVASWPSDLVERRRSVRVFIVSAAALYGGLNAGLQIAMSGSGSAEIANTVNLTVLAGVVAAICYAMMRVDGADLFPVSPEVEADTGDAAVIESSAADQKLIDALMRLMEDERIYRHDNVTIGTLATKLGIPEYKLRRLINQRLGYRNFNVFLNEHRIAEAKAALADPSQAEVPVITIAMDAGFQSLGPFNRAFKATTGVTPTEYRRLKATAA